MVNVKISTREFWRHPKLNVTYCTDAVLAWMEGRSISGEFHDASEARPGDVVVYGDRWDDCTFGIFLAPGRIATTIINPDCWGKVAPKLLLVRTAGLEISGRKFNVGVRLDG